MTSSDQGHMYLKALYGDHEGKFINLRVIDADDPLKVIEEFHPTGGIEAVVNRCELLKGTHNVYVGVAARDHESGKKEAVSTTQILWVDCDSPEASEALKGFKIAPSIVIASGTPGNCHAYWFLIEPVSGEQAENLNHRLALRLGGDVACRDRARILRVPGTLNHKSDPPNPVTIETFTDSRYDASVLDSVLEKLPVTKAVKATRGTAEVPSPVVQNVLVKLDSVTQVGTDWKALCPAHDDHNPSLSVSEGDDGRCLINCFANCAPEDVVESIGLTMSDLMPGDGGKGGGKRVAARIVDLAFHHGVELFHSEDGDAWMSVEEDGRRDTWQVESRMSEMWLRRAFYDDSGEAAARDALSEATAQLAAHALFRGETHETHVRVSGIEAGPIYLDLGNEARTIIKVDGSGFEVAESEVPYFRRSASATGLPVPDPKGSVDQLREFVSVRDEGSWMRLIGFLVMCFHPSGPYPVLSINGEQGSAKTTTSRLILSLVDPHKAGLLSGNPALKDLAITASSNWLVVLDNVSAIKPGLSDALCRVSTGGGLRTRQLYTDTDEIAIEYRRPVVVNGIGSVIKRPDLLDRTAPIELRSIAPEDRRTEDELMTKWEQAQPSILGGLLNAVVAAIANHREVELKGFPRMADWARWVEAASGSLGWEPGAFTAAIESGQEEQIEFSIDDQIEVRGLIELTTTEPEIMLTATDLLKKIHEFLGIESTGRPDVLKRGADLSRVLQEFAPALRKHGITVEAGRHGGGTRDRFLLVKRSDVTGSR